MATINPDLDTPSQLICRCERVPGPTVIGWTPWRAIASETAVEASYSVSYGGGAPRQGPFHYPITAITPYHRRTITEERRLIRHNGVYAEILDIETRKGVAA